MATKTSYIILCALLPQSGSRARRAHRRLWGPGWWWSHHMERNWLNFWMTVWKVPPDQNIHFGFCVSKMLLCLRCWMWGFVVAAGITHPASCLWIASSEPRSTGCCTTRSTNPENTKENVTSVLVLLRDPYPSLLAFGRMVSCGHKQMQEWEEVALGIWKGNWGTERELRWIMRPGKMKGKCMLGHVTIQLDTW